MQNKWLLRQSFLFNCNETAIVLLAVDSRGLSVIHAVRLRRADAMSGSEPV